MRWFLVALVACACPSKQTATAGSGANATAPAPPATTCEGARARVEQLYRVEAQAKEPKRVEAAVADNTAMVMTDCNKDAAKVVPCLMKVQTVAELEQQCLVALDDEGTEGGRK